MTQFQFEDRFRLGFRKAKPRHQRRFRFIFITNDLNHFVDIEKRHQQTFEDMQALEDFLQTIVQSAAHGIAAEHQPFGEDFQQVFHRRTTIQTDHIKVNTIALFQIGGSEEVVHHLIHIHAVGTRHNHQAVGFSWSDSSRRSSTIGSFLLRICAAICSSTRAPET